MAKGALFAFVTGSTLAQVRNQVTDDQKQDRGGQQVIHCAS